METLLEKKAFIVNELKEAQTWSSDIPEEIIHSFSPNEKYKVRKGRFGYIVHGTEFICHQILIDEKYAPVRKELMDTLNVFCNNEFRDRLTTKEDIAKGDKMIEKLITMLETLE